MPIHHTPEKWPRNRLAGEPRDSIEKHRVVPNNMVTPGLASHLRGGQDGVVLEGGAIRVDGINSIDVKLQTSDALEPGTEVSVWQGSRAEWAKPLVHEQAENRVQRRLNRFQTLLRSRHHSWRKDHRRAKADAFWSQYNLPVQVDIAIKGRLSGLTKGSWGDGRAGNTVEHAYLRGAVSDGQLKREADSYLCDPNASPRFNFDDDNDRRDSDGATYTPPVTCQKCLNRLERWRVVDEEDVEADRVWEPCRPQPTIQPVQSRVEGLCC